MSILNSGPIFKRRPFKLTRGGWIFILYTIGVGAGAINTGNNLLHLVFGIFLGLILASGVLSDLTLWGLSAEVFFPLSGRAGQPLLIPVRILNSKKWFSSLDVQIKMEGVLNNQTISLPCFCPCVEKNGAAHALFSFTPAHRGWFQMTRLQFSSRFPFGLLFKIWTVYENTDSSFFQSNCGTLVCPSLVPVDVSAVRLLTDQSNSLLSSPQKGDGASVFGVRTYQPSDNPRRIHWRASAKRAAGWLVREMEHEQEEEIYLVWPENLDPSWEEDTIEQFISYAASLVSAYEKKQMNVRLLTTVGSGMQWTEGELLWKFLSVVDPRKSWTPWGNPLWTPLDPHLRLDSAHGVDLIENFRLWRERA